METFQYSIPAIFALAIVLLIQLLKAKSIPINIPPAWQPAVATTTGLALLIATRIAQGFPVGRAVFDGLLAGLGAVGMFEVAKQVKGPPSGPSGSGGSALPPDDPYRSSGGGAMRVIFGMTFALLAFGCTDAVGSARSALDEANKIEVFAAEKLDEKCGRPMKVLALEPPGNDRTVRARALAAKCDKPELAYDALRKAHANVVGLLERGADGEITVGDLVDATTELMKAALEFEALVEELDR